MEYYFFIIIVIIVLKILFWTFYFYVRAQRVRQMQNARRIIIVEARPPGRRPQGYNDRSAIIRHAEPVSMTGPPPYSEVVKDEGVPLPPPYSQVEGASPPVSTHPVASGHTAPPAAAYSGPAPAGGYPEQFVGYPSQTQSFSPPLHSAPSSQNPTVPMQSIPYAQSPSAPPQ
ncbi:uncharacterized protein [Littorina saxatilis]|uniref:Uncharacterized protein n=1 Tax=Littorina saxatilis TaxID=31220 RepID=A0AAN9GN77_9CAEN